MHSVKRYWSYPPMAPNSSHEDSLLLGLGLVLDFDCSLELGHFVLPPNVASSVKMSAKPGKLKNGGCCPYVSP